MAVASGEALPPGEKFERLALRIGAAQAIGVVEAGDARRPELGRLGISQPVRDIIGVERDLEWRERSEEHTSELQSLMRISYAVFCLKKKKNIHIKKEIM